MKDGKEKIKKDKNRVVEIKAKRVRRRRGRSSNMVYIKNWLM
jgi:hypothetical protein